MCDGLSCVSLLLDSSCFTVPGVSLQGRRWMSKCTEDRTIAARRLGSAVSTPAADVAVNSRLREQFTASMLPRLQSEPAQSVQFEHIVAESLAQAMQCAAVPDNSPTHTIAGR
jgi:hypothetical protein